MTGCFRLVKALQQHSRHNREQQCPTCVYFSKNLDPAEPAQQAQAGERCGLAFLPGDDGCVEMRTDNCSARKG